MPSPAEIQGVVMIGSIRRVLGIHEVSATRVNGSASMKVHVTRDSVCQADDVDAPHARQFTFPYGSSTQEFLSKIVKSGYLASIDGGYASWVVISNIPIAVVAQQWPAARLLTLSLNDQEKTDRANGEITLHFEYHQQADPEAIYARLQLLARMQL